MQFYFTFIYIHFLNHHFKNEFKIKQTCHFKSERLLKYFMNVFRHPALLKLLKSDITSKIILNISLILNFSKMLLFILPFYLIYEP